MPAMAGTGWTPPVRNTVTFDVGYPYYFKNNQTPGVAMSAAHYINASGRVMVPGDALDALGISGDSGFVPIRQVAGAAGYYVSWDDEGDMDRYVALWPMDSPDAPAYIDAMPFSRYAAIYEARQDGFDVSWDTTLQVRIGAGLPVITVDNGVPRLSDLPLPLIFDFSGRAGYDDACTILTNAPGMRPRDIVMAIQWLGCGPGSMYCGPVDDTRVKSVAIDSGNEVDIYTYPN
jgi:hypothetical protein